MGIETEKLTVGKSVFSSSIKFAKERLETDEYYMRDVGALWAADRIRELEIGIREHRQCFNADEGDPHDLALWALLTPPPEPKPPQEDS